MPFRRAGKTVLSHLLNRYGYTIQPKDAPLRGFEVFLEQCKARGLTVATVFDAGVGMGTPWLYEAFPESKHVLFEPLERFVPIMEKLKGEYDVEYHRTALGSHSEQVEIHVPREFATSASLKTHSQVLLSAISRSGTPRTYDHEMVSVSKLDDLNEYEPRYLLKIDVEGSELDVLMGAERTLQETELVVVESSLAERYDDGCTFADVVRFMDTHGFALYEIVDMGTRSVTAPVAYLDAAFVPKGSKLRAL